jgi:DNA-directed RNA polymerase specialized sigma24 family protein
MANSETPVMETYQDVENLLYHISNRFQRRHGGDIEELEGEAKVAFMRAYRTFDPSHGAQFPTYLYHVVWNHFVSTFCKGRLKVVSLDQMTEDTNYQAPDKASPSFRIWELLEGMSEDAAVVVNLVFQSPAELAEAAAGKGNQPRNWRSSLRTYLKSMGWKETRITTIFNEIAIAVG